MLDIEQLMQAAGDQTGLADYGSDDFREPLERLVFALNSEARLNDFGKFRAQMTINAGLCSRLAIADYLKASELDPERISFVLAAAEVMIRPVRCRPRRTESSLS